MPPAVSTSVERPPVLLPGPAAPPPADGDEAVGSGGRPAAPRPTEWEEAAGSGGRPEEPKADMRAGSPELRARCTLLPEVAPGWCLVLTKEGLKVATIHVDELITVLPHVACFTVHAVLRLTGFLVCSFAQLFTFKAGLVQINSMT